MKIALPSNGTHVDEHFGHCQCFTIFDVDNENTIVAEETLTPPPGYRVARLPRERKLDGPAAALAVAAETKGNAIVSDYRLTIKRRVVPVDAYANFRAVVQEARALPEDLVVLEREAK